MSIVVCRITNSGYDLAADSVFSEAPIRVIQR